MPPYKVKIALNLPKLTHSLSLLSRVSYKAKIPQCPSEASFVVSEGAIGSGRVTIRRASQHLNFVAFRELVTRKWPQLLCFASMLLYQSIESEYSSYCSTSWLNSNSLTTFAFSDDDH